MSRRCAGRRGNGRRQGCKYRPVVNLDSQVDRLVLKSVEVAEDGISEYSQISASNFGAVHRRMQLLLHAPDINGILDARNSVSRCADAPTRAVFLFLHANRFPV